MVDSMGRRWNPALHPRDRKGRFTETGGLGRLWGRGLVRILRALPGDRLLVEDRHGEHHTVRANTLTMVRRPDGSTPTDSQTKVEAEDARRHADPNRGDGWEADDRGEDSALEEDSQEPAALTPEAMALMDTAELEAAFTEAFQGSYDRATAEAVAAEIDRRDSLEQPMLHDLGAADPYSADFTTAADSAWPPQLVAWSAGPHKPAKADPRAEYESYAEFRYAAAEKATRGQLFSPAYRENPDRLPAAFTDLGARAFFYGVLSDAQYRKYASEELLRWFADNGRGLSFAEWLEEYHGWKPSNPERRHRWLSEHG